MPKKAKVKYDGIYERPDANGYWGSWTAADGRRVRRRFHVSTLEQARTALAAEKLKVEEQIKFGKPLPTEETFTAFATDFLKHQERRIASQVTRGKISATEYERQRGIVEGHLTRYFGQMRLASIRRKDVKTYIDSRTGEVSDGTIIKECNVLKRMLNLAVELEKIAANPAHRAPLPQAPEGRNRYLTADELGNVLKACPEWLRPIAGLAVALGTRRGELLAVRWEDIDDKAGTVLLRHTKNGKKRPAFINDLAAQVLASMRAGTRKKHRGLVPRRDARAGHSRLRARMRQSGHRRLLVPRSAAHLCIAPAHARGRSSRSAKAVGAQRSKNDESLRAPER